MGGATALAVQISHIRRGGPQADPWEPTLSETQFRVLRVLSDGKLKKQIVAEMNLREGTVMQRVSAIPRKLEVALGPKP